MLGAGKAFARAILAWYGALFLAMIFLGEAAAVESQPANGFPDRLDLPVGLTAGGYDHFQGQLSPAGESLYFISNARTTTEMHVQNLARGAPALLFDDNADVNQPRLSPDGKRLLYISYQEDAGGDACIYHLQNRTRRCLTEEGVSVLHLFWFPDSQYVGVLVRLGLFENHQLWRLHREQRRGAKGQVLLQQNMSSPAVSPDGRWLAYVPLERDVEGGSGSLMRASPGLMLQRLDQPDLPLRFVAELSGTSGFPAFSSDGRYLYFTQFLNDTNFDGAIDGDDNGVLFRVAFNSDAAQPVQPGSPEQLTSGGANCQYPAPARERLIATCTRAGFLQIYSIPLAGLVPTVWTPARIQAEIAATRDPWERLLLLKRLLPELQNRAQRATIRRRLVLEHIGLREYESAEHHLHLLLRNAAAESFLAGWSQIILELIDYRREEQRLPHGKIKDAFIKTQQTRLMRLQALQESPHPTVARLARLAAGEIYDVLGDKHRALAIFDAIDLGAETDPTTLHLIALQQQKLLRLLDERERLLQVYRQLAAHPAFSERERLRYADAFRRHLLLGQPTKRQQELVTLWYSQAAPDSPLAFLLQIENMLLKVRPASQKEVAAHLQALYHGTRDFERRRALVMITLEHGARGDYEHLLYVMGRLWLEAVPEGHPERKYAEAIFSDIVLERAYVELAAGRTDTAAELFYEVTRQVSSLEAHEGYLEAKSRQGRSIQELLTGYTKRYAGHPQDPTLAFVRTYLGGRRLPAITDPKKHRREVERDLQLLAPAAEALPRSPEVQHLYAYLAHRQFHFSGDKEMAMVAHTRYHLALDLAPRNPRRRASVLHELGLLQAARGNHHLALRHFRERERWPFSTPIMELSFRLAKARSHYHVGHYSAAMAEASRALDLVRSQATVAQYAPLVLDRAALYHYVGGAYEEARQLYLALQPKVTRESLAERMKAKLGLGATLLKVRRYQEAVTVLRQVQDLLASSEPLRPPGAAGRIAVRLERDDYRPIVAGLLAQAYRGTGEWAEAMEAMRERRHGLRIQFHKKQQDAYLQEAAAVSHHLAELAYRQAKYRAALRYVEEGLVDAELWRKHTGTEMDSTTLALLRAGAELHLYGKVPLQAFSFDFPVRLKETLQIISRRPNPRWAESRFLLTGYLTWLDLRDEAEDRRSFRSRGDFG